MSIRIGTYVKVKNAPIKGKVTHIQYNANTGKPIKYKVKGRYWDKSSVYKIKQRR